MRHCFEYFWPRDDARVYADGKTLEQRGYVTAERTQMRRRTRTSYTITSSGRRTLRGWLAEPSRPVALEFQGLIKVYLARFGTLAQLRQTVAQVRHDAEYMLQVATNVRSVYLEGCAPFQEEYVHVWAFAYDFLANWFRFLHDWAERTLAEIDGWHDLKPDAKRKRALQLFQANVPDQAKAPDLTRLIDGVPALPGLWRGRRPPSGSISA
jgi:PadR family transcriptional regulator, regulatory protein AphA